MAHFAFWAIWATWTNNQRREKGNKMIEKLKWETCYSKDAFDKINELIDAVNEFQKILHDVVNESVKNMSWVNSLEDAVFELRAKVKRTAEPADPYAEQRKWIGKLCRFWDGKNPKDYAYGTLIEIDEYGDFKCDTMTWFNHCEPVNPEDDIIYKKD